MSNDLALEGIRIVDLSRVVAGPYCTMVLADMGAEVIKIEMPGGGDDTRRWTPPDVAGESPYYLCMNRNKKSVTLNLKTAEGLRILSELVTKADVLVENFKTGGMEEMGLGWDSLQRLNPKLVYCSLTGYGSDGPYANKAGYDFIIQAESGLMSITGDVEGQPMRAGIPITDMAAGMFAACSILAALRWRDKTGLGQKVELSLIESAMAWLGYVASNYLIGGLSAQRWGNSHPNVAPYDAFKAKDKYIAVCVGNDSQFRRFCQVIGQPEWADDPRFGKNSQRVANRTILIPLIRSVFLTRDGDEWIQALTSVGVPCGPINTIDKAFDDPHIKAREVVVQVDHPTAGQLKLVGPPYKFSRTPATVRFHPPLLGEHTAEVLTNLLGYCEKDVDRLRGGGAV